MKRLVWLCILALLVLGAMPRDANAWTQCVDFRLLAASVTDPEKCSYSLGASDSASFPIAPICNGCVSAGDSTGIGWTSKNSLGGSTDNVAFDAHLVGDNRGSGGASNNYNISAPSGTYTFVLGFGLAAGTAQNTTVTIKDNTTTCTSVSGTPGGTTQVIASDAVSYTATAGGTWSVTGITKTVSCSITSGTAVLTITGNAGAFGAISNIIMTQSAAAGGDSHRMTLGVGG